MKTKHNKKRNTAFIFETLIREVVKTIMSRDARKKKTLTSLITEHFKEGTALRRDLYRRKNHLSSERKTCQA